MVDTTHVIVVIGGGPLSARACLAATDADVVIAADSGLDHALTAGLVPSLLVGDLDSVSESGLRWAEEHHVPIERHPTAKDATDTELALAAASALTPLRITLLGGVGDRLDHLLGTLLALGDSSLADHAVDAVIGETLFLLGRSGETLRLPVAPGGTFSLLALHGSAHGVTLTGAEWPLEHADIAPTTALGLSNRALTEEPPMLSVTTGIITAVVP